MESSNTTGMALIAGRGARAVHSAGDRVFFFNPVIRYIFFSLFELPLLQVYLFGPSLGGYGFWQGQDPDVICSSLTGVPASHWAQEASDECCALIYRRFEAYMVMIYVTFYLGTFLGIYGCCILRLARCRVCCKT